MGGHKNYNMYYFNAFKYATLAAKPLDTTISTRALVYEGILRLKESIVIPVFNQILLKSYDETAI